MTITALNAAEPQSHIAHARTRPRGTRLDGRENDDDEAVTDDGPDSDVLTPLNLVPRTCSRMASGTPAPATWRKPLPCCANG